MRQFESGQNGSPAVAVGATMPSPLKSPVKSPRTPTLRTPGASPAKLAPNHAIFMTNIDSSPTRRKDEPYNGSGSSSTKVIENLHEQIDSLTNTNLQLTLQSNNLLSRLEAAQQRESKLLETTASLKHENENVGSMLNRKSRRLKDLEDDFSKLQQNYDDLSGEKKELEDRERDISDREVKLRQELEMIRAQYDALVDSQQYYRKHYTSELDTLKEQLETFKQEQRCQLEQSKADEDLLHLKLVEFETKCDSMKDLEIARLMNLENRCNEIVGQLDLSSWFKLYEASKNMLLNYAQEMNFKIPDDLERTIQDTTMVPPQPKSVQRMASPALPLKMAKVRNTKPTTSPNANAFSSANHAKRSSFYGAAKQVSQSAPGALPGVKRSSSRRQNSGRSDQLDSSADSSPILRQNARHASSPSPRMVSQATFKRN